MNKKFRAGLKKVTNRQIWITLGLLGLLVFSLIVLNSYLHEPLEKFTYGLASIFGFWGLCLLLLVSDSLISPLPPDLILLVIAKSSLREHWPTYVLILSIASVIGGHVGYWCGRLIFKTKWMPHWIKEKIKGQKRSISEYGGWAVVLGALTPLPYSITCWAAGLFHLKYRTFFWASLTRFFRIFIYYLIIHYSSTVQITL